MVLRETPRKFIMGRGPDDSLLLEVRPQLDPQSGINFTQITKPGFGYESRRLTPLEESTLVTFERAQVTDDQALRYARRLEEPILPTIWPTIFGHLVSKRIPQMEGGRSLFQQREEIIVRARAAAPTIGPFEFRYPLLYLPLAGVIAAARFYRPFARAVDRASDRISEGIIQDTTIFNDTVRDSFGKVVDPYSEQKAALVVKTIGIGGLAIAQIVKNKGSEFRLSCHGRKDARAIMKGVGLVFPDRSLHSFSGRDGCVLREGRGRKVNILVSIFGSDESLFSHDNLKNAVRPIAVARLGSN
ncbi:hypothetical protein HYW35_00960 [Candidatus Saccharibacteria bacterium]|nr:hypothetical protein [Candidatus Saccharibacteria bacterium]